MKHTKFLIFLMVLTGCQSLPQLYQTAEDIADDTAVKVEVSREAIQKQTDVDIIINIKNNQTSVMSK